MMDIARDPRWGRIAESLGEDPYLAGVLAAAMVRGFQGDSLAAADSLAACAEHYVGYGATEGGRDYNTTWIPEVLLRNVYLRPFRAARDAGVASYMTAFNDLNGVPASGNPFTVRRILRDEWKFDGFVVSDYTAIEELIAHGYAADQADAALKGICAGVDMEMISTDYYKLRVFQLEGLRPADAHGRKARSFGPNLQCRRARGRRDRAALHPPTGGQRHAPGARAAGFPARASEARQEADGGIHAGRQRLGVLRRRRPSGRRTRQIQRVDRAGFGLGSDGHIRSGALTANPRKGPCNPAETRATDKGEQKRLSIIE